MKRRPIFYLLSGAVALTLTACKTADLPPEPTPVPTQISAPTVSQEPATSPSPTPEPPSVEPVVYAPDVPPGDYAPWQTAYADFLTEELRRDVERVEKESGDVSDLYCLYDADEDGVPELFIQYGVCEADYHTVCYTFRDGRVEALKDGDFPSGHGMIYTCPGEKAFLFSWGHMGYAEISKVPVENGGLGEWETLLEEDTNPSAAGEEVRPYTHPSELVSGAEAVPYYYTRSCRDWGRNPPLVLPIYDYGDLSRRPEKPQEEAEVRAAIGEVLWENRAFNGYSGDNFYGSTGWVTLEEYLKPGAAYPYGNEPLTVTEYAWADVNGDGQTDCILRLEKGPDQNGNVSRFYSVLTLQGEEACAYFFGFTDGFGVDPDGTVYLRNFGQWEQVSFYKDQCYTFPAPQDPVEGCDLAWDPFPAEKP